MLKMDTQIDIGAFWSWWTRELLALLPANVLSGFNYGKGFLIVEPTQNVFTLYYQNRTEKKILGEFDESNDAQIRLQKILDQDVMFADAEVLIRLPESLCMHKLLSLPEAAGANLKQVLTYELDRYTPFKAEQVYYDVLRLGKPVNAQLSVALMVVQRQVLDAVYEQVTAAGLKPAYADSAAQPLNNLPVKERYNLLPDGLRHVKSKKPQIIMFGSIALTTLLLVTLFIAPLWGAYQGIDKLKVHMRKVEKLALQVEDTKQAIDYLYQATNKLIAKKNNSPVLVDSLNILSKELKDDTWVSQVRFSNGALELLGESASASELIATLEKTSRFKNTRFISPVTQDRATGKERFQLTTEIIPVAANATQVK